MNLLEPFSSRPDALLELLRPLFPTIRTVLPMEDEGRFVAYEWIGAKNYLGEKVRRTGERTRGANFTSADAAVMFAREDGARQIALIEWKYTESYPGTSLETAASGTSRRAIYEHLYKRDDCPVDGSLVPDFGDLFYEPFYQFMRQQFLAHEMERAHELGADVVSLLHIAPAHNRDFQRVTSPHLRTVGERVTDIWARLVTTPGRFKSVSVEEMFGSFPADRFPDLTDWWEYINERYSWIKEGSRD